MKNVKCYFYFIVLGAITVEPYLYVSRIIRNIRYEGVAVKPHQCRRSAKDLNFYRNANILHCN